MRQHTCSRSIRGRQYALHSFSLSYGFIPLGFSSKVFNEAASPSVLQEYCTMSSCGSSRGSVMNISFIVTLHILNSSLYLLFC
ncbi:hypothetical protein HanRHA438_Chr11g0481131 [Helianthus annuus]|nr:hypothetical protein HanIR_Chr11g0503611 [Helianthus annuus]KAJ0868697.1 hypothetical protein HanRHA438_Chr11g0481131 [Helianthus annuus]